MYGESVYQFVLRPGWSQAALLTFISQVLQAERSEGLLGNWVKRPRRRVDTSYV